MSARPAGAAPGAPPAPPEQKKGEVNELRTLLRSVNMEKDTSRKQGVIKKVIAYMTLGIDVSRLFSDMILACNTRDLVIKKMVYLYLCTYAHSHPDITLLAINTLQKDCRDEDPMVRGMALRALTSLRLLSILEYVMQPLKSSLTDSSGYVRQAGVMGILKVWHLSPEAVHEGEYIDVLYNMIKDRDAQVVVNCITVLNEILADEGGIAANQAIVHHLLSRIREFSDWGQCIVMDLVARYKPASEEELFGIMNLLDGCLKVANSAVVLATTKCFTSFTEGMADIQRQVALRLKTPLLTLQAGTSNEITYAVLAHVALIIDRNPGVFDDEFKQFFCKYNEPGAVKFLKMSCLPHIANPANAREIVAELTEYVSGVDIELARKAVRAIGEIAIRVPVAAEVVVESMLELVEMEAEYVRAETVIVMQDLLRKYPDKAPSVIPSLHRCLKRLDTPSGKAAVIWMLGEFGQLIDDAPYLLEPLIDGISDEPSMPVRCELLTATVKLFFKRPPEVQRMLGRLFKACLADGVDASVHDRALLYYRLLRANVGEAAAVIAGDRPPVLEFRDDQATEVADKIWAEFNTLSVLYGKPSQTFIAADHMIVAQDAPGASKKPGADNSDDSLLANQDSALPEGAGAVPVSGGGAAAAVQPEEEDLLGISFGGGGGAPSSSSAPAYAGVSVEFTAHGSASSSSYAAPAALSSSAYPAQAQVLSLVPGAVLDPDAFQGKWLSLPVSQSISMRLSRLPNGPGEVETLVRGALFSTIASGELPAQLKFYLYARDSIGAFHLVELLMDKNTGAVSGTVKSDAPGGAPVAVQALSTALRPMLAA